MPDDHHSSRQPRHPDGRFAGPPRATATSEPRGNGTGRGVSLEDERKLVAAKKLAAAANAIRSRMDLVRRADAGKQYEGRRRIWKTLGYPEDIEVPFEQYLGKYKRGDVAGKIVDAPAKGTWRRGVEVVEVDEDGNAVDPSGQTDFERDVADLFDRLDAEEKFERVDQVSGIGRYGVYVIGSTKMGSFEDPISRDGIAEMEDVAFLSVFHEGHAKIDSFVKDENDPRFGLPEFYQITFRDAKRASERIKEKVHWSRVVHVAENPVEDDVFGTPRLQRVFNRLEDALKIAGGSAEMFWSNVGGLLWGKVPPGTEIETEDKTADEVLEDTADALLAAFHEQRRVQLTQGLDSLEFLGGATPDPSGVFGVLRALLAAGSGIPESVLFGSERGDVAKSEDVRKWNSDLAERQERHAGPKIAKPLVEFALEVGIVSKPAVAWEFRWPPLGELDEKEEAEVVKTKAEAAKAVADAIVAGGDRAIEVLRTLIPELEGALDVDLEGLAAFVRDEDEASLEDVERYLNHARSAG